MSCKEYSRMIFGVAKCTATQPKPYCISKLAESYRSWFQLRKVDATANPPMFRKKDSVSTVTFTKFATKINDTQMELTLEKGMHVN